MSADLLALADRCEAATGPDAEADYQIHAVVMGWRTPDELNYFSWFVGEHYQFGHPDDERRAIYISESELPNYTASIDAALTLLPGKDWEWSLEWETGSDGRMFARCALGDPMRFRDCEAATSALAICAAALRARAA